MHRLSSVAKDLLLFKKLCAPLTDFEGNIPYNYL
jgi:hypothetical protein